MEPSWVGVQPVNASAHSLIHPSIIMWRVSSSLPFQLCAWYLYTRVCVCIHFYASVHLFHCGDTNSSLHQKQHLNAWKAFPLVTVSCFFPLIWSSSLSDLSFITTWPFLWKVSAVTLVSCLPLYVIKYLKRKFSPPSYSKLSSWSQHRLLKFVLCFSECPICSTFSSNTEPRWTCGWGLGVGGSRNHWNHRRRMDSLFLFTETWNELRRKKTKASEKDWNTCFVAQRKSWRTTALTRPEKLDLVPFVGDRSKCLPLLWRFFKNQLRVSFYITQKLQRLNFYMQSFYMLYFYSRYSLRMLSCIKGYICNSIFFVVVNKELENAKKITKNAGSFLYLLICALSICVWGHQS